MKNENFFKISILKLVFIMVSLFILEMPVLGAVGFTDVTQEAGLTNNPFAGETIEDWIQVSWIDYNNDGFDDILLKGQILYKNNGNGTFTRVWVSTHFTRYLTTGNAADFDNDGDIDILNLCGANVYLWRNDGWNASGIPSFTNVTVSSGISGILGSMSNPLFNAAAWGDFNNDGYVDLFIGGHSNWGNWSINAYDFLLINNQNGTFRDESQSSGIRSAPRYSTKGVTCADFDRDGDLDIYVCNYSRQDGGLNTAPNQLWRNNNNGTFTDIAYEFGVQGYQYSEGGVEYYGYTRGAQWGDYDNDGDLDLYVCNLDHGGEESHYAKSRLYRNNNGSGFTKVYIVDRDNDGDFEDDDMEIHDASPQWLDYDNDGDLDLFFTCIYPPKGPNWTPTELYANQGNFVNVNAQQGINIRDNWGCSTADYNNDGKVDLLVGSHSMLPGTHTFWWSDDVSYTTLYKNNNTGNNWIKIRLQGAGSNKSAIGAMAVLKSGSWQAIRLVDGGHGYFSCQDSLTLTFGLGGRTTVDRVEIFWPDGTLEIKIDVPVNQTVTYVENPEANMEVWVAPWGNDSTGDGSINRRVKTIQRGLDIVRADGTLYVAPGHYVENLRIRKPVFMTAEVGMDGAAVTHIQAASKSINSGGVILVQAPDVTIRGFHIYGGKTGILVATETGGYLDIYDLNLTIVRNIVENNDYYEIKVSPLAGGERNNSYRIINNTIIGNGNAMVGIYANESKDNAVRSQIRNNIIANHSNEEILELHPESGSKDIYYNLFYYYPRYVLMRNPSGNTVYSYSTNNASPNPQDPGFADQGAGDYHLLAGSIARDAGDPAMRDPLWNDEDGTRNDMGALSYGNAALGRPVILHDGDVYEQTNGAYSRPEDWLQMNDGNLSTGWSVVTNHPTESLRTKGTIDLQGNYELDTLKYKVSWDTRSYFGSTARIKLMVSSNNINWQTVDERSVSRGQVVSVNAAGYTARYIRIEWVKESTWHGWGNIYEFEAYGVRQ